MDFKTFSVLILIVILMHSVAPAIGWKNARPPKNYLVTETITTTSDVAMVTVKEQLILIKNYGETYILRPLDLDTEKVTNKMLIWNSEEIAKHKFSPKYFKSIKFSKS